MGKLCIITNFAPRYREGIFLKIDNEWDTDWFFGRNHTDIKGLDTAILKHAKILNTKKITGNWYWQMGSLKLASKNYSKYLILGDPYCVNVWLISIILRLFRPKKRLYFWTHGWYGKEGRATKLIKKLFFRLPHGIFLYGNYAKELMLKEGFDKDKLFVIHNSLKHSEQIELRKKCQATVIYANHFGNSNPVLIFIGRLSKVKRLELLLEAASNLKQRGESFNVVIIGDGEQRDYLKQKVKEYKLEKEVWFYGACYDDNVNAELIYNADLCVAPGNVGLTAMHTMVFGTPVITHNDFKWQMPEFEAIIPNKTGNFFKKDDADDLADKISLWLHTHPDRDVVRRDCYKEIDSNWTPHFQMNVLRKHLKD